MKKIISYFIAILISICIIISIILTVASNTLLNCDYALSVLNKNDYYGLVDTEIKSNFEGYIKQSGFDEEILENVYSKEKLKSDIETVIKATYSGEEAKIETESISTNLRNNIDKYLKENNITLNNNEQKNMEEYIQKLIDVYDKEVSHPVYLDTMKTVISKTSNIIEMVSKIIYGIILGLAILIIIINIKSKYNAIKIIFTSTLTASLFILLGILMLNLRINIDNIIILNTNFSLLIISIIKDIMSNFVITSTVLAAISIIIILLCNTRIIKLKKYD